MITKTLTQLITSVRAAVYRRAPNAQVDDTELTDWINDGIRELWQELTPVCRDEFTTISGALTIAVGVSTLDLGTLLTSPAYLAMRGLDRLVDGAGVAATWKRLKAWKFPARSNVGQLSYHLVGKVARVEPAIQAPGTYRVWYIPVPTPLTSGANTIDLPFGGDKYVIQGTAAQVRAALMEDPAPHLALQEAALKMAKRYMATHATGDQDSIIDVSADYDPDLGGELW